MNQQYRAPKLVCENCKKDTKLSTNYNEHCISECPHILPYFSMKQNNLKYLEESKQKQERSWYLNRSLKKGKWIKKLNYVQSCAKKAFQHFGSKLNSNQEKEDSLLNLSQLSALSIGGLTEREEEEEDEDDFDQQEEGEINRHLSFDKLDNQSQVLEQSDGNYDASDKAQDDSMYHDQNDDEDNYRRNTFQINSGAISQNKGRQHKRNAIQFYSRNSPKKSKNAIAQFNSLFEDENAQNNLNYDHQTNKNFNHELNSQSLMCKNFNNNNMASTNNQQELSFIKEEAIKKQYRKRIFSDELANLSLNHKNNNSNINSNNNCASLNYQHKQTSQKSISKQQLIKKGSQTQNLPQQFQYQQYDETNLRNSGHINRVITLDKLNKNMHDELYSMKQLMKEEIGRFKILFTTMQLQKQQQVESDKQNGKSSINKDKDENDDDDGDSDQQSKANSTPTSKQDNNKSLQLEGKNILLDMDRMFKFKIYRKECNYDLVLKKERDRQKKAIHQHNKQRANKKNQTLPRQNKLLSQPQAESSLKGNLKDRARSDCGRIDFGSSNNI